MNETEFSIVPGGYREVLRVAWPLIISTGSFTLMQFIDRVFLARYSTVSIQAALPAGILSFTMICGFMAVAGYANTLVAQYHGAGRPEDCARATMQGVWFSLLSWPLLLALIPAGRWLLAHAGHPAVVVAEELTYFTILLAGGFTIVVNAAVSSFFTGRGDTFTNMVAVVVGNVINIGLDYVMIFGKCGLPEMGIRGAAWATVIAGFVTPAILFALYFGRRSHASHRTRDQTGFDRRIFGQLLRLGLPAAVQFLLDVGSFTVFILLVGRMGELPLAVSNIALSINMIAFMPLVGISIAATTLVGQYQGARAPATAEKAALNALRIGVLHMVIVGVTYALLPEAYFRLFAQREGGGFTLDQMLAIGRPLLLLMAAWGVFDAVNMVLSGALKGAGDTRFVMWVSVLSGWVFLVPVEVVLIYVCDAGILAAWSALLVYVVILGLCYGWRFRAGRWKSIAVVEPHPPHIPPKIADDFAAVE